MKFLKIGVMGGSFDPPHQFHLAMAERAWEFLGLDLMIFMPACSSPPKCGRHAASFGNRVEMLEIALRSFPGRYEICDIEARPGGISYAADSAREISERFAGAELYWILGSDQLAVLHGWKDIEKLSKLVSFAFFQRTAVELPILEKLPQGTHVIEIPFQKNSVSSTRIREELQSGARTSPDLDHHVIDYILKKNLYI